MKKINFIIKVIRSCKTIDQTKSCRNWIENVAYKYSEFYYLDKVIDDQEFWIKKLGSLNDQRNL